MRTDKAETDGRAVRASVGRVGRRVRLVLVALAVLAAAWLVAAPPGGPPLYDGLGFPDQPYRFLDPPTGYGSTASPTAAAVDARVGGGADATLDAPSAELGPQVEVFVSEASITAPAGATLVHVRAEPVRATRAPADGEVWGNAYRLSARSDAGAARVRPGGDLDSIRLRAPTGPPPVAVIEFDDGSGWRRLATSRIGSEIYAAPLAGVGEYAVVAPPGQARASGVAPATATGASAPVAGSGGANWTGPLLIILVGGIGLLAVLAVAVRLRRRGSGPPGPAPPGPGPSGPKTPGSRMAK